MFNFFKKKDSRLQEDIENELKWDPSLAADHIGVAVKEGIVTLSGSVPHYSEKSAAESAAQRVAGVRAVVDELKIDYMFDRRADEQIASAAVEALKWNYSVPEGVTVVVDNAWITLNGEAEWDYERRAARSAVSHLVGVRGVINNISLKEKVRASDVKGRIEEALKRSAQDGGKGVSVTMTGNRVTLSGNVKSLSEVASAAQAAWSAPGVMSVENNLIF